MRVEVAMLIGALLVLLSIIATRTSMRGLPDVFERRDSVNELRAAHERELAELMRSTRPIPSTVRAG